MVSPVGGCPRETAVSQPVSSGANSLPESDGSDGRGPWRVKCPTVLSDLWICQVLIASNILNPFLRTEATSSAIQHVENVFNGQTVNLASITFVFVLSCYSINQM